MQNEQEDSHVSTDPKKLASPWLISTSIHMAIIITAVLVVWSNMTLKIADDIIPETVFSESSHKPLTIQSEVHALQTHQSDRRHVPRQTSPSKISPNRTAMIAGGQMPADHPFENQSSTWSANPNPGPFVTMFSCGCNATKIVYLIDASGSLIDTLPFIITDLKRSIHQLSDLQYFTVLFYQGDNVIEWAGKSNQAFGLKRATLKNKQHAHLWLNPESGHITPGGSANPVPALKTAFKYKPELVYLLSDNITGHGRWQLSQESFLETFQSDIKHLSQIRTRINTIQFLYEDPLTRLGMKPTLSLLAQMSGGRYKFISARELGIDRP